MFFDKIRCPGGVVFDKNFGLIPDTHVSMKKIFKNFCHEKCWGWGGCNNPPPRPEREGVAAKINKFSYFSFSYFFFLS